MKGEEKFLQAAQKVADSKKLRNPDECGHYWSDGFHSHRCRLVGTHEPCTCGSCGAVEKRRS